MPTIPLTKKNATKIGTTATPQAGSEPKADQIGRGPCRGARSAASLRRPQPSHATGGPNAGCGRMDRAWS